MAIRTPPPVDFDDRDFYPLHEEDDVPETTFHRRQVRHLDGALSTRFPERLVTGNICIYWERGNTRDYRAPDVFVTEEKPDDPEPRVYHVWRDPPILFAAEIGSRSTFREDEGPKQEIYERLVKAREYLYSDPPKGDLRLWRIGPQGYEQVAPEPNGRVRSVTLELEFGIEAGYLRIYTLDGERLRTHEEAEERLSEAEGRLSETEERLSGEAELRRDAEARAAAERQQREELERQLAALRARLQDREA